MRINDINGVAEWFGTDVAHIERDMYKYTSCGAWITWTDNSVTIGSIVEGSDAEFSETFEFPTTSEDLNNWIDELERLTDEAWKEANYEESIYENLVCDMLGYHDPDNSDEIDDFYAYYKQFHERLTREEFVQIYEDALRDLEREN